MYTIVLTIKVSCTVYAYKMSDSRVINRENCKVFSEYFKKTRKLNVSLSPRQAVFKTQKSICPCCLYPILLLSFFLYFLLLFDDGGGGGGGSGQGKIHFTM